MELQATPNPIDDAGVAKQVLANLFYGWGYNFYRRENQLRADDLLIRGKLSEWLGQGRAHLAALEAAYRRDHLPAPSREHPFPDAVAVAHAQSLQRIQQNLESIETAIRTASVPEMDRIHQRHRDEGATLARLINADGNLVLRVKNLYEAIVAIGDGGMAADEVPALLKASGLEAALREREQILSILKE